MTSLGPWHGGGGTPYFSSPFSSDPWDPWDYGRGGDITDPSGGGDVTALAHAKVDWRETDGAHIFTLDLPGVRKEDLKVQVEDDNVVHIGGERIVENVQGNDKWHRVESRRGSFTQRFRLPENADVGGMKCALDHGVLTLELPKKEPEPEPEHTNVRYIHVA